METKTVLHDLRTKAGLSQDALAGKVFVTRQAVSRWETGETVPNTETLKLLSGIFGVSINTLLGSPRQLVCQCCGMPLDDTMVSREKDGSSNDDFCKWCYADGHFMYSNLEDLIEVCTQHMVSDEHPEAQVRAYLQETLPQLAYWKQHDAYSDGGEMDALRQSLTDAVNALHIAGMPKAEKLNALVGGFVNLAYKLPGGESVKFLDDQATYLGCQLAHETVPDQFFGVIGNADFLLVCTYTGQGENPELLLYQKH